jgi:hypothetical protein
MNLGGQGIGSTSSGGGGGSFPAAGATVDSAAGTTINLTANTPTWNISAPVSGTNTYDLPVDAKPVPHTVSWGSGLAPVVSVPATWKVVNPVTGDMTQTTYTYGQDGNGAGESYGWVADVPQKLFWPVA